VSGNGGSEAVGATRQQPPLSEGTRCGMGASVRTVRLTGGSRVVLIFFQFIQNWLKFKNSKWVPYLALKILNFCIGRLGYCEQFSQLCRHPIPNIMRAKNLGSDSTFESLMNFKRDLNLPEKSGKFPKISSVT
jgi:hypothetical protein